jgi:hypothetical protein
MELQETVETLFGIFIVILLAAAMIPVLAALSTWGVIVFSLAAIAIVIISIYSLVNK